MTDHPYYTHALVERHPSEDGLALLMLCAFEDADNPNGSIRRGPLVAELAWPDRHGPGTIAARVVAEDTLVRVFSAWRLVPADPYGADRYLAKVVPA